MSIFKPKIGVKVSIKNQNNQNQNTADGRVSFAAEKLPQGHSTFSGHNAGGTIALLARLLEAAHSRRASDIHIDPGQNFLRVRLRVDGVLQELEHLPKQHHGEIISRIKILSGLRTDEHQAAQDGRFRHILPGGAVVDIRVAIAPTYYGENAVLRLLSDTAEEFTLESLGFSKKNQEKILRAIKRPYGMILVTGPTGSGKTTTLYSLVRMLNSPEASVVTIEDPIEYALEGLNQIQTNPRAGLTFSSGLRSILRQDPNVIMVGEIRDAETAGIAVNTALTGHLLLSTLHTSDAATTLPRLLDLKIESYLIASTVHLAIGQRLVRKICSSCRASYAVSKAERKSLAGILPAKSVLSAKTFFRGSGCDSCAGTGYFGRIGIHEVLVVDTELRQAILSKATAAEIKSLAVASGMQAMAEDGFYKAALGLTTTEEVLRTLYE